MLVIGIYCFQTVSTCNRRAMEEFQRQNKKTSTLPRYLTSIIDYLHKKVQYLHCSQVISQTTKNFQQRQRNCTLKLEYLTINPVYTG
jgi:hypothetical protein